MTIVKPELLAPAGNLEKLKYINCYKSLRAQTDLQNYSVTCTPQKWQKESLKQ